MVALDYERMIPMTLRAITGYLLAAVVACHPPPRNDTTPAQPMATTASARPPIEPAPPTEAARSPGQDAYDRAFALAMDGNYNAALPLFRAATALDPQLMMAWFDLARLLEIMGDKPEALVALEQCVALEPRFSQARAQLASLILDVREDGHAAMVHLRLALTEPAPFVTDRGDYPDHLRGVALRQVAIAYAWLGFPAATAAIERSLAADPAAEGQAGSNERIHEAERQLGSDFFADPDLAETIDDLARAATAATTRADAAAALKRFNRLTVDLDLRASIDGWQIAHHLAQLQVTAGDLDVAAASLRVAATTARALPLDHWLDNTYALIVLEVKRGRLDAALAALDELAWLELVTAHAAPPIGGRLRSRRALSDAVLAPMRAHAGFEAIVATFGIQ